MRYYDVGYIADPELDEEALDALETRVKGWIEAAEGKILEVDRWGKRRLAYPIRKRTEGFYVFLHAEMPPQAGGLIERDFRLTESILRYLISLKQAPIPTETTETKE